MPYLVEPLLPDVALSGRPQPRLQDATVALRPWSDGDAAGLVSAYLDPDIQRWHCRSLDESEAATLIREWRDGWAAGTGASWAVTDRGRGDPLGRVAFRSVDLADGTAELAYWVLPAARGRGVAAAAVRTLSRWAFDEIGFQRLELKHSVGNIASCKVALATGFSAEGTLRASARHTDGWHDMHLHGRLRTDPGRDCGGATARS